MRKWHRKESGRDYVRAVRLALRNHLACTWHGGMAFSVETRDDVLIKKASLEPYPRRGYAIIRKAIAAWKRKQKGH